MRKTLPTFYYLEHFHEFLTYFSGKNQQLLTPNAVLFIQNFLTLEKIQQGLLVRIANRKHPVISIKSLEYEELPALESHLQVLISGNWLETMDKAPLQDIAESLPKAELITVIQQSGHSKPPSTLSKANLVAHFCQLPISSLRRTLSTYPYVYRQFDDLLTYLLFLYFGHLNGRLNQFSMRDLGVMRTRSDVQAGAKRFDSLQDATGAFFYAQSIQQLSLQPISPSVPNLHNLPDVTSPTALRLKNQYLYALGKAYLLSEHREWALSALAMSDTDKAQEKWIREQYKDGNKQQAKDKLDAIITGQASESLLVFAEDFYARKFKQKRTSILTDILRNAHNQLEIDSQYLQQVEQGVISKYRRQGLQAWKTENTLWRSLFGLVFWPIIFSDKQLANEFERKPAVLKFNQVYDLHQTEIDKLLGTFTSKARLTKHITQIATQHYGQVNCIFRWKKTLLDPILILLEYSPLKNVVKQLLAMSQDYSGLSDGYPDLMVLDKQALRFEEVKAPGDKLRRNQLTSLQCLTKTGFTILVTQVTWTHDPEQPYVVVDIETTGGGQSQHRITEIGMVKMIGSKVIDRWQSLINPQRNIPAAITRLTGIDNQMVCDAPRFADCADEILAFTENCIFVAHNVNFDLGFFKQEFERLGHYFKRPKLCTVQQVRKHYPGLTSYSLAALTQHFDIDMARHHRAMSDALAAAELLKLVLAKESQA